MEKLRTEDETLFKTLKACWKSRSYKQAERLRNDLTHNYRPNFVDVGIKERREGDKLIFSGSLGHYTTTTELITNIEAILDLLIDAIRFTIQTESE